MLETIPVSHVGFDTEARFAVCIDQGDFVKEILAVMVDLAGKNLSDKAAPEVLFNQGILVDNDRVILDKRYEDRYRHKRRNEAFDSL